MRYEKILLIEDGYIGFEELEEKLKKSNPEILLIRYRSGSNPPTLLELSKKPKRILD